MPLEYRNFKAWIYCEDDGEILEEYKATQDPEDERVYTCWVTSEAGKRFTVHWESLMKAVCDNKGVTFVDGVETHSYVNIASFNKNGSSTGVKTGTGEIRPYAFSDVILTDDDAYLGVEQSTDTEELGNITLKIYLIHARFQNISRPKPRRHHQQRREVDLYDGAIHEITKKVCDHRITLGDAVPFGPPRRNVPNSRKLVWEPVDRSDMTPHVVFRFKYRPRAFLQAQRIIPLPLSFGATPQKPIIINTDNQGIESKKQAGQKRKRPLMEQGSSQQNVNNERANSSLPLFLPNPSLLQDSSQPMRDVSVARSIFYEAPRPMRDDEDVVVLGYSEAGQQRGDGRKENANTFVRNVRTKQEPITPVKVEGLRLWMDSRGVIDLTMDD